MNIKSILILSAAITVTTLHAGPRSSASYAVPADTVDAGGSRAASAHYTHEGSLGGIAGLSTVAAPAEAVKAGYIGQLYDIAGLLLTASPTNVNEGATLQLGAAQLLDDSSTLVVPANAVAWSVLNGPLSGIDASGEGTADIVYQNTAATARGSYAGNTNQIGLLVLNVNHDDYGMYAADGLDDGWQNQYFGLENPDAAPLLDPDGDQQNNLFEFIAGLVPTNYVSRFLLDNAAIPGQPDQQNIIFSPRFTDRTYAVLSKSNLLAAAWVPLASSTTSDDFDERTVTDLDAAGATKFYHVEVTKP